MEEVDVDIVGLQALQRSFQGKAQALGVGALVVGPLPIAPKPFVDDDPSVHPG